MYRLSDAQMQSIELTQRERVSGGAGTSCLMQLLRVLNDSLPEKPVEPADPPVEPVTEPADLPVSVEVQETTP